MGSHYEVVVWKRSSLHSVSTSFFYVSQMIFINRLGVLCIGHYVEEVICLSLHSSHSSRRNLFRLFSYTFLTVMIIGYCVQFGSGNHSVDIRSGCIGVSFLRF